MNMELLLKFEFEASHSLSGYEIPHPHLWLLEIAIGGKPIEGRILDIITLRARIQKLIASLSHTYLNDCPQADAQVRKFPTCETLSHFFANQVQQILADEFLPKNPSLVLTSVMVTICEMDRTELGAARLRQ